MTRLRSPGHGDANTWAENSFPTEGRWVTVGWKRLPAGNLTEPRPRVVAQRGGNHRAVAAQTSSPNDQRKGE